MLARKFRLEKKDIERLFKKGSVTRLDSVLARFMINRTDHPRFAVVIPKKTLAKATQRNRARRLIYQFLSDSEFFSLGNKDVAFFLRNFELGETEQQIRKIIERIK